MGKEYVHVQTAHCENGVTTGLLKYHGLDFMTEPLAFGIGSGLFYIHVPFLKVSGGPALSFRTMPGNIFNRTCKALQLDVTKIKFKDHLEAKEYLDNKIENNIPVGCQVGVYNLTYFPVEYRFHFNGHNIIVYGKKNENYLVSDPTMEDVTTLSEEDMDTVRFAKGIYAPKGHVYFIDGVKNFNQELLRAGIIKGIKRNTRDMLYIPGNIAGVGGIKYTARKIRKWRDKHGPRRAGLFLGQIVRMQEEIGTGGGGFRFIYGAFLEQAAEILKEDRLNKISEKFTKAGDMWRSSAMLMAGVYKGRTTEQKHFNDIADHLFEISDLEREAFKDLKKLNLN